MAGIFWIRSVLINSIKRASAFSFQNKFLNKHSVNGIGKAHKVQPPAKVAHVDAY